MTGLSLAACQAEAVRLAKELERIAPALRKMLVASDAGIADDRQRASSRHASDYERVDLARAAPPIRRVRLVPSRTCPSSPTRSSAERKRSTVSFRLEARSSDERRSDVQVAFGNNPLDAPACSVVATGTSMVDVMPMHGVASEGARLSLPSATDRRMILDVLPSSFGLGPRTGQRSLRLRRYRALQSPDALIRRCTPSLLRHSLYRSYSACSGLATDLLEQSQSFAPRGQQRLLLRPGVQSGNSAVSMIIEWGEDAQIPMSEIGLNSD